MIDLSEKTALVFDRGSFMKLAERLGRDFKKVYYFNPCQKSTYPKFSEAQIGQGLKSENVEWLENFWDVEPDIYCFPDSYDGDLQLHLRSLGKRVFGSGKCEELELLRVDTLEYMAQLGLPIPDYEEVEGLDALREYLKANKDVYVKCDRYRGTFETFHSENYKLSEPLLDKLEAELGPSKNLLCFSVFEPIEGVEIAYDGYCIDGEYPKKTLYGIEIKDMGYIGHVKDYNKLYKEILNINEKLAPTLKANEYRNFISPEMRVDKKGVGYIQDFCCRQPSPVSECYYELLKNFSEIVWFGAEGKLIEPVFTAEYAMTLVISSDWAMEHWQAVHFPKEIKDWVKLRSYTIIDGTYYVVPNVIDKNDCIGVVVAIGSSLEDCAKKINGYADQIKGYRVNIPCATVEKMQKEIDRGTEIGIKF